jgi:hypothetical protein
MLPEYRRRNLRTVWYVRCFVRCWGAIDARLLRFGGLHRPALRTPSLVVEPGITLPVGGGDEVPGHLPTTGTCTFAFTIGIKEEEGRGVGGSYDGDVEGAALGEDGDREENN